MVTAYRKLRSKMKESWVEDCWGKESQEDEATHCSVAD